MRAFACVVGLCGLIALGPSRAHSISKPRLRRILRALKDRDLRVRVQALAVLGKLRERRAVRRIISTLRRDRSALVRALAAVALGAIGDQRAVTPLKRQLKDRSRRVRRRIRLALSRLRRAKKEEQRKLSRAASSRRPTSVNDGRIFVRLGSMATKATRGYQLKSLLRRIWTKRMRSTGHGITLIKKSQPIAASGDTYELSSAITRLRHRRKGSMMQIICSVSVVLGNHLGRILMMTDGGATVEVPHRTYRSRDGDSLEVSALESAIGSAHQNLVRFLRDRKKHL